MSNGDLNWIANFIWGIADDVLRDLYVRGKYRDVILPMTVLRRLDAVLEPTKQAVLDIRQASQTKTLLCAKPQSSPSITLRNLPFGIYALGRASNNSRRTSRPTSTVSRRTCRRSSIISNSAIRFPVSQKLMRLAR